MTTKPPDLYAVNSSQLTEEMKHIEVDCSMRLRGPITIIAGVRRDQISDLTHQVLILKTSGQGATHLIVLPGSE